jgi:hypothetical protein
LTTQTLYKPLQNYQECKKTKDKHVFLAGEKTCENDNLTTAIWPSLLDEILSPQQTEHSTTEHSDFGSFLDSVALPKTTNLDLFYSQNPLDNLFQQPFDMERSMSNYSASTLASPFALPEHNLVLSPVTSEQSQFTVVHPQAQVVPPARKRGRKRKELELDHQELIAEIEDKRRRNTESARRNRIRRKNELQVLEDRNATLLKENAKLRQMLASLGVQIPS